MVVNSEVAEGDLGEALPNFVKNLSALFAAALFIGGVGLFWGNQLVNHLLFRSWDYLVILPMRLIELLIRKVNLKQNMALKIL